MLSVIITYMRIYYYIEIVYLNTKPITYIDPPIYARWRILPRLKSLSINRHINLLVSHNNNSLQILQHCQDWFGIR